MNGFCRPSGMRKQYPPNKLAGIVILTGTIISVNSFPAFFEWALNYD